MCCNSGQIRFNASMCPDGIKELEVMTSYNCPLNIILLFLLIIFTSVKRAGQWIKVPTSLSLTTQFVETSKHQLSLLCLKLSLCNTMHPA